MNHNKISVSQFFICMFLCNIFLVFGFLNTLGETNSFFFNILTLVAGVILLIVSCIPSYLLYKKTGKTTTEISSEHSVGMSIIIKLYYLICFVIFASVITTKFAIFLKNSINHDAMPLAVVFAFLLIAAFGSYKGMQALFRTTIIIFAFALLSFAFVFFGLMDKLDFSNILNYSQPMNINISNSIGTLLLALIPIMSYVVFSDSLKGNHKLGIFYSSLSTFVLFLAVSFFTICVLGNYVLFAEYPFFTLSKLSTISMLKGGDGFVFATITAVTFLLVYLFFVSGSKALDKAHSKTFSIGFFIATFVLSAVMTYVTFVYDFITNTLFLSILLIIGLFILPLFAYSIERMRRV